MHHPAPLQTITVRENGLQAQELIPGEQGAPPQNPPTASAGGSCGRLWGKAVLASTSSQRAPPQPRSPLSHAQGPSTPFSRTHPPAPSRTPTPVHRTPLPSRTRKAGAGWCHPASSRTPDMAGKGGGGGMAGARATLGIVRGGTGTDVSASERSERWGRA